VAYLVARKNILAASRSATKIRGGATMVASCERGLNRAVKQHDFVFNDHAVLIYIGIKVHLLNQRAVKLLLDDYNHALCSHGSSVFLVGDKWGKRMIWT
jgi:hypothetical protein